MSRLGVRIVVVCLAVGLVGVSLLDVAALLWLQRSHTQIAIARQEAALRELSERLAAQRVGAVEELLQEIDQRYNVVAALQGPDRVVASRPAVPVHLPIGHTSQGGRDYLTTVAPTTTPWLGVTIGRELAAVVEETLAMQPALLPVLTLVWLGTALLSGWFLSRTIVRPLARLHELVGKHDVDALARLGLAAHDDIARLGRAIAGMTERLAEDRRRIAEQLTALAAAHRELAETQRQLLRAERLAVTGQLAAGLAHEIGNPLGVLSGYLDMLRSGSLTGEDLAQAVARMQRELTRVNAIVHDLLGFARAPGEAAGQGDAVEALAHVRALVTPHERFKTLSLDWPTVAGPVACKLSTDRLTQVLMNLLLNAADALAGGGKIRVRLERSTSHVTLAVEDSGPGVPAELRAKIFSPFFTTKHGAEKAAGGTGLGLAVCESLVSAAGGDLRLEATPLGGAAFVLSLPA